MINITINYDFTTGREFPLYQAKQYEKDFETHCTFFLNHKDCNVTVKRKDGRYINNQEIYLNDGRYTDQWIRPAHNLERMFRAGCFEWQDKT